MDETIVISVTRKTRPKDTMMRRLMAVLAVVFLLQGIVFSTAFMLPCFLMAICYYWFRHASKKEYEYILEDQTLKILRVSDRGRNSEYEIPFDRITLLCRPDAPEAMPYKKKGGTIKTKKEDYTSYQDDIPYYTMIVRDEPRPLKLLLDLTPEAIRMIRRWNRDAVKIDPIT